MNPDRNLTNRYRSKKFLKGYIIYYNNVNSLINFTRDESKR